MARHGLLGPGPAVDFGLGAAPVFFTRERAAAAEALLRVGVGVPAVGKTPPKRKLSVAFNALPQDQDLKRTWRGSEHSDWTVILGHEEYSIHKVIVATGDHASHFLAAAFRKHCGKQDCTDLTSLIPQRCWQNFEAALEFLYTGEAHLTVENWAAMLKMADLLQIVSLYKKCVDVGADLCTRECAPRLAADTVELQLGGEIEQQVVQMAIDVITPFFMAYEAKDLAVLPAKVLQQLLRRADLEVPNEDYVFKFLLMLSSDFCSDPDYPELWKCCQLQELSSESILEAAKVPHVSKEALARALARKCDDGMSPAASAIPRELIGTGIRGREIFFMVRNPCDYQPRRFLRSPKYQVDDKFKWSLVIFPLGTDSTGTGGHPKQVASFVELEPEASVGETWTLKGVRYQMTLVNWKDETQSVTKDHVFNFSNKDVDNGWHRGWATPDIMTKENGWINDRGEIGFRAQICSRQAVFSQHSRSSSV